MDSRPLNGLESIFAMYNVSSLARPHDGFSCSGFALLVELEATSAEDALRSATAACDCRLGHVKLTLSKESKEEFALLTSEKDTFMAPTLEEVEGVDPGSLLDQLIQEDLPALGAVEMRLIRFQKGLWLYLNGNHAICDGRSLTALASATAHGSDRGFIYTPHADWSQLASKARPDGWEAEPEFLDSTDKALPIAELCPALGSKASTLRFHLPSFQAMLRRLKEQNASLTGFLAAVLMESMARETSEGILGVSVLVDLRPQLATEEQRNSPFTMHDSNMYSGSQAGKQTSRNA